MNNAVQAYQGTKINTANPAERTLMLYDGVIKFCNIALGALESGDLCKVNHNIIRAEKIIVHLRETLDHKYPVSQHFDRVYVYIYDQLITANIRKDKDALEEALTQTRVMRDTWKEVMELNKRGN